MAEGYVQSQAISQVEETWDTRKEILFLKQQLDLDLWKGTGIGPATDINTWADDFLKNLTGFHDERKRMTTKLRGIAQGARAHGWPSCLYEELADFQRTNRTLQGKGEQMRIIVNSEEPYLLQLRSNEFVERVREFLTDSNALVEEEHKIKQRIELIAKPLTVLQLPEPEFETLLLSMKSTSGEEQRLRDTFASLYAQLCEVLDVKRDITDDIQPEESPVCGSDRATHGQIMTHLRGVVDKLHAQSAIQERLVKDMMSLKDDVKGSMPLLSFGEGAQLVQVPEMLQAIHDLMPLMDELIFLGERQLNLLERSAYMMRPFTPSTIIMVW
ncbi:hypothetical protein C8T65DRAFT_745744 [Cerioporus squamosus]|nr:hypothetical protein C8T65DRAFT_745744 [Cerioporus squamosus]